MTGPSVLAVGAALAAVLGTLAVLTWVARRLTGGSVVADEPALRVEVLSRAALAPKQGLATVRVGHRAALVGYGEGGVRLVMVLDGDPGTEAGTKANTAAPSLPGVPVPLAVIPEAGPVSSSPFAAALSRARRAVPGLKALSLLVLLAAFGAPASLAAETPGAGLLAPPPAETVVPSPASVSQDQRGGADAIGEGGVGGEDGAAAGRRLQTLAQRAPGIDLRVGGEGEEGLQISGPVGTVLFIGFLTLIPTLLLLMTSFTRILIVLHLLKQALGTQTAPPAHLLSAMALLLTGFVMAPTFERANDVALRPWMDGEMDEVEMLQAAAVPFRDFMLRATREQDLAAFVEMRGVPKPRTIDDVPLVVVTSAFVTSELTSAFQMGFALFLPFVIIDVVVASVLMSMGMFMLPPVMVSLPFKLLLFVLVDGWSLVVGSLVASF